jgi:hypothetical protein
MKKMKTNNETKKSLKFKNISLNIDLSKPTFIRKDKFYYFLDIDKNQMLHYADVKESITPEMVDIFTSTVIYKDVIKSLTKSEKLPYAIMLICLLMGGLIGYAIFSGLYFGGVI